MFRKKEKTTSHAVFVLGTNTVWVYGAGLNEVLLKKSWKAGNLGKMVEKCKKKLKFDSVEVVLSENLFQATSLTLAAGELSSEKVIKGLKEAGVIENDQVQVDWKVVKTDGEQLIQVVVVKNSLLDLVSGVFAEFNLKGIKTLAERLAVQTETLIKPHVIVWQGWSTMVIAAHEGKIYHVHNSRNGDIYKNAKTLLSFLETETEIKSNLVVMTDTNEKTNKEAPEDLMVASAKLDPSTDENENLGFDSDLVTPPKEVFSDEDKKDEEAEEGEKAEVVDQEEEAEDSEDENPDKSDIIEEENLAAPKPPLKVMQQETPAPVKDMQVASEPSSKSGSNKKLIVIILTILVVLIGVIVGGVLVYKSATSSAGEDVSVIESDATPTPEPSPAIDAEASDSAQVDEEVDRSEFSIQVLNGSGIPGEAGKLATILETAGFEDIDTGNAESFEYEETEVQVKSDGSDLQGILISDLEGDYDVVGSSDDLDEDSEFDAVVIVGSGS